VSLTPVSSFVVMKKRRLAWSDITVIRYLLPHRWTTNVRFSMFELWTFVIEEYYSIVRFVAQACNET
jgi:hypothetical protein